MFEHNRQGAVDIVSGNGPLDRDSLDQPRELFADCLRNGLPRIVFDMENILLVDSAGLELLLDVQDLCSTRGGTLHLARPNGLCRDILRISGVGESFETFDDLLLAVRSFSL